MFKHGLNLSPMFRRITGTITYLSDGLTDIGVRIKLSWGEIAGRFLLVLGLVSRRARLAPSQGVDRAVGFAGCLIGQKRITLRAIGGSYT